jgi:putative endonuclease
MNEFNRKKIGNDAEETARIYLQKQGLILLERNYRCYSGELDLIMRDRDMIVFVEVRSKSRIDYGHPAETITRAKQKKIIRAATHFLQKKAWLYKVYSRFDVVAIEYLSDKYKLDWIKNAFLAEN